MKKSIKILLSILCLCPILLFSACGSSTYYTINVYSSDSSFGSVIGAYTNPKQLEGTKMTLFANENNSTADTNPFICWIKDDNTIISTDNQLSLTYTSSTAGDYVALFEETRPEKMIYMLLDNLIVSGLDNYSNVSFTLTYATIGNSNIYINFESGILSENGEFISNHTSVIYLGSAGELNSNQYRLKLDLTIPTTDGSITNTYISQNYINNASFNNELNSSITLTGDDEINIILNFEKLNKSIFEQDDFQN